MTENEIYDLLESWENIDFLTANSCQDPKTFEHLMSIALFHPKQKSWRAAYLADKVNDKAPKMLLPYLPSIIKRLKTEVNASKKRHWLKLISVHSIDTEHFGFLFDYCISVFTSAKEAIAVRVHAMQILYNISEKEPELKAEVLGIIEHELEYHSTPGIRSRGRKLAQKLHLQIHK